MAIKLNRKGVGLSGAERDKENENLALIEQELNRVGNVKLDFDRIVAEAGSNNPEVVQARGTEINLNARLDKTNAQVAEKVAKGQVAVSDIDKNKGLFDQTYLTDELKQQIAGTAPINAVPANLSLVDDKYAFQSIKPEKLSFVPLAGKQGKNLFDKSKAETGKYVSYTTGTLFNSASFTVSDWIVIKPNTYYTLQSNPQMAFYTDTKQFISGVAGTKTILSPANAKYMRISTEPVYLDIQQVEEGQSATFYQRFGNRLDMNTVDEKAVEPKHLKETYAPFLVGKNLFNKNAVVKGQYVKFDTGNLAVSADYSASDFIPVDPSQAYTMKHGQQIAFYTAGKTYISGQASGASFTTPTNAAFVRITVQTSLLDSQQLEKGTVSTEFEDFGFYMADGYNIKGTGGGKSIKEIIVAKTGGQFTTVSAALASITDNSQSKPYRIFVRNGTYNDTFRTKHYVDIIGEDKYKTIIDYVGNFESWVTNSTIFGESNSNIENMTVSTFDTKYPLHSDAATGDYKMVVKNCVLHHRGFSGAASGTPFGIGLYKNQHIQLIDCELIGDNTFGSAGVFFHNMASAAGNGYRSLRVENCKIRGVGYGFRANGIDTVLDQKNDAFLINNDIQAELAEIFIDASADLSWNIVSRGNTLFKVHQPNNTYIVEQPGFTKRYKNTGAAITRGDVVLLNGSNIVVTPSNALNSPVVVGVALENIATNARGVVQTSGFVNQCKVGGTASIASDTLLGSAPSGRAEKSEVRPFAIAKGTFTGGSADAFIPVILLPNIS